MFTKAHRMQTEWRLFNSWGHSLTLPCRESYAGSEISLGVLGTRTRGKVSGGKTKLMMEMLAALDRPLYLLDTRRDGVGGQGSWSPCEFSTMIADHLAQHNITYSFLHLPCLAPSLELLRAHRKQPDAPWQSFRDQYVNGLLEEALEVARAFVEAATAANGLAIFLCAEDEQPEFDQLPPAEQNDHFCHRFALTRQLAHRLKQAWPDVQIKRIHLDMTDYKDQQQQTGCYSPRVVLL